MHVVVFLNTDLIYNLFKTLLVAEKNMGLWLMTMNRNWHRSIRNGWIWSTIKAFVWTDSEKPRKHQVISSLGAFSTWKSAYCPTATSCVTDFKFNIILPVFSLRTKTQF